MTTTATTNLRARQQSSSVLVRMARLRELSTVGLLVLVVAGATIAEPRFLSAFNLRSVLLWVPLLACMAMGMMMVIITRGIDVSVGSTLGFAGIVVGMIFRDHPGFNIYLGTLIGILLGAILGAVNGTFIAWVKIPPVIATLGTLSAYRGLTFIVSAGRQIDNQNIPVALIRWSQTGPLGTELVPWIVVIALSVAILTHFFMRYSSIGRNVYTIGSNPDAARLRGIPVEFTIFVVYMITGAVAGLAGVLYSSRMGFVNPGQTGVGLELTTIAAVVIGGTNVFGGSGSVLGVLLGCLLLGTINVALAVLGVAGTWQLAVYGLVILLAVIVDALLQRQLQRIVTGE
jgi:rhamnose transport system permease protein